MIQPLSSPLVPTHPAPQATLADLVYRSRITAPEGSFSPGDRMLVAGLSLLLYGGLGAALLLLGAEATVPARAPRTVTLSLVEGAAAPVPSQAPEPVASRSGPAGPPPAQEPLAAPLSALTDPPLPIGAGVQTPGLGFAAAGGGAGTGLPGGSAGEAGGSQGNRDSEGIVPPRFDAVYLQNPSPDYPSLSRRFREEGRVVLRVRVKEDGSPQEIELKETSGHARLDRAALEAVRHWRFAPARRGAVSLAAWVLVPLSFSLDA